MVFAVAVASSRYRRLLNVDYVTSFELPFRLLLIRTPQLISNLRIALQLNQKEALFNGKLFGCVWSLQTDLSKVPDAFQYHLTTRIWRVSPDGVSAVPFQQIAKEVKTPRERIRLALDAGLQVTVQDALFWFGCQRIAADVLRLRRDGMVIATSKIDVFDTLTGTTRQVPVYRRNGV